jgi:diketogulonate reductase-like aldo/keto reductase
MLTRPVPASGEAIPVVGLGTWQTFDVGTRAPERATLQDVLGAFATEASGDTGGTNGGPMVDTSPMYGNAETVLGDLMAAQNLRPRLFVATKVWTSGREAGIRQMEESMRKLRVERVDLMQVHNLVDVETHLDTLRGWKEDGRVRYVGVTHFQAGAHEALAQVIARHTVDFLQVNYSIGEPEAERRLLPLAQDRGVAVIVNRPFGGGGLLRRLGSKPLPAWAAELGCETWGQLLLKFVVSHPAVTCAIPATSNVDHLRDNLKAGDGPLPDEATRARIASAALTP